jgi:hypothetical protein
MKSMDFFVWQGAGGVNSWLFTTSATRPGGKRRDFMVRYDLGLVLAPDVSGRQSCRGAHDVMEFMPLVMPCLHAPVICTGCRCACAALALLMYSK